MLFYQLRSTWLPISVKKLTRAVAFFNRRDWVESTETVKIHGRFSQLRYKGVGYQPFSEVGYRHF
jgi:hypothetical protein